CIGDTVFGAGLSASTARLLACDAKIIPVVLGSNSEPLDVGRCERLVTKGMRRALNTRDRGCVVCGAPPVQCDAHHLRSWIDGGTTAVSNLVLLCRIHHVDLHAGKWVITITNGKVHVALPTWANPPSIKRRTPPRTPAEPSLATARAHATCTSSTTKPGMTETGMTERCMDGLGARGLQAGEPGADGLVRCGPEAGGDEGSLLTATDIRAATMRAVWGEDLPPEPARHRARLDLSSDFDPWGEAHAGPTSPPCPT
ncbi:HNH endonuclease signature motif containing protein, partial [Kribbella albertanoniae]|uniref:HNH endonuclease signature motif containing protein n=1 Tax=Kribbella albertanoniae TaxID=1266829 RepID=UPI00192D8174